MEARADHNIEQTAPQPIMDSNFESIQSIEAALEKHKKAITDLQVSNYELQSQQDRLAELMSKLQSESKRSSRRTSLSKQDMNSIVHTEL